MITIEEYERVKTAALEQIAKLKKQMIDAAGGFCLNGIYSFTSPRTHVHSFEYSISKEENDEITIKIIFDRHPIEDNDLNAIDDWKLIKDNIDDICNYISHTSQLVLKSQMDCWNKLL